MSEKGFRNGGSGNTNFCGSEDNHALEAEIFKCEEVLRQAMHIAGDAFWDWNIESGHLTWNEAFDKVPEYPPATTDAGETWWREHIHPEDRQRVIEGLHRLIDGDGTLWWDEYRFLRADGSYTRIMDRGMVLRRPDGKATRMVGTMFDLTLRQQAIQCLREAKNTIAATRQVKRDFLNNISHELRTPMTVIIAGLELLAQSDPRSNQRDILDMVEIASLHLKNIINDLFDFSRAKTHQVNLAKTLFDLRGCLEKMLGDFRTRAEAKGLCLECDVTQDVPEIVYGAPEYLTQVLMNLLENAIKFTERGEVRVNVRTVPGREQQVLFSIQDSGIGIPAEKRSLLFQDFRHEDSALNFKYGGPGLGLLTSKKLVELMGGVIWAESEPGQGSVFSFALPLR